MDQIPIYQQLRNQIVAGIAAGELRPGEGLPSVRALAADLGINLHTVNKAYALLRDEGYLLMRGRAGAIVAEPPGSGPGAAAEKRLADGLALLAAEHKAAGGSREAFEAAVAEALDRAYGSRGAAEATAPGAKPGDEPDRACGSQDAAETAAPGTRIGAVPSRVYGPHVEEGSR